MQIIRRMGFLWMMQTQCDDTHENKTNKFQSKNHQTMISISLSLPFVTRSRLILYHL